MTDYVKLTNFATKDSLASGNPLKVVSGTEINAEFDAIATAVATKFDSADLGVTVQAYDAQLADIAGLTPTDNGVVVGNGTNFVVESGATLRTSIGAASSGANADITSMTALTAPTVAANPMRAADIQAQLATAFTTGGTGTAFTLTPSPAITAYTAGQEFDVSFNVASGASPTLTISGVGTPPTLVKQKADGSYTNIAANDIPAAWQSKVKLVSTTQALVRSLPVATPAEAQALTDALKAITPATLAAAFQASNQSKTTNGYQKLPGGLVLQWGYETGVTGGNERTVTFPLAFPTACLNTMVSRIDNASTTSIQAAVVFSLPTTTQVVLTNGGSTTTDMFWFATGY